MSLFLTTVGILLLLTSLAGIAFGAYMSTHPKTRESGGMFALLWVPALAAAVGILLRDPVTVVVSLICFVVAGATLYIAGFVTKMRQPKTRRTTSENRQNSTPAQTSRESSSGKKYRRAAS